MIEADLSQSALMLALRFAVCKITVLVHFGQIKTEN